MLDLEIESVTVIDATGAPRFEADVGVRHDAIAAVGDPARRPAGVLRLGSLPGRVLRRGS